MHRPKIRVWLVRLAALAAILAACAQNSGSGQPSGAVDQPTGTPAPPQQLVIWHAYKGPERTALEQIRRDFEIAHPMIDVQLVFFPQAELRDSFETAVLAGGGPDLLIAPADWLPSLTVEGLLEPLRAGLLNWMTTRIPETAVNAAGFDDVPYGAVFSVELATLYSNHALVPDADQVDSVDDLRALASGHGLIITPSFSVTSGFYFAQDLALMDQYGMRLVTQAALEVYLTELQTLAAAPGIAFSADQSSFLAGQTGLLLASSSDYLGLKAALGGDLRVVALPRIIPLPWRTLLDVRPVLFSLNMTAAAIDAANTFMEFWLGPDPQRIWFEQTGQAPANPAGLDDPALLNAWRDAQAWAVPAPLARAFNDDLRPALDQAVRAVTLDGADPSAAAAQLAGN